MSFWTSLFGPSTPSIEQQLLDALREDRAQQATLMTALVQSVQAQADLAAKHLGLLTHHVDEPNRVRLMTSDIEARHEQTRVRQMKPIESMQTVPVDTLLADLEREFGATA